VRLIDRILQPDNLRQAWEEVAANKGAAGIDDVSIARWRRNWEERLVNLAAAVRANTYKPRRLRRFSVPKSDGSTRQLSILTVTDRVLQRAVLRVVDDRFDRQFLDCSYGYRPGRGLRDAVPAILHQRDTGRQWVLDADIDECFDSLDHGLLNEFVREEVDDPIVRRLIEQWLHVGRRKPEKAVGIPLGAVISPLLCNVYLHRLDLGLTERGYSPVRYADDFCVFCVDRDEAEAAWQDTERILAGLKLRLEPHKTAITHFDKGFDYLGVHFYRDTYSFVYQGKRVKVEGDFDWLFYGCMPDGYEG
jgi:group II intron reverse transcriptase/maturase